MSEAKIIRPITVAFEDIVSTSAVETVAVYNAGTTYALGDKARDEATHSVYVSAADGNSNKPLTDPDWWLYAGPDNRMAMFDAVNGTQTSGDSPLDVEVQVAGWLDSVALFNLDGSSARIIVTGADDAMVHDKTYSLLDDSLIVDLWSYWFEELVYIKDLVVTDIPVSNSPSVTLSLVGGGAVKVGSMIVGLSREIGYATYGSSVGLTSYSVREVDEFGNYKITPRRSAKRGQFKMFVETGRVDALYTMFDQYRDIPVVWVMTNIFARDQIFGFYKDLDFVHAHPQHDEYDLVIEGLT